MVEHFSVLFLAKVKQSKILIVSLCEYVFGSHENRCYCVCAQAKSFEPIDFFLGMVVDLPYI